MPRRAKYNNTPNPTGIRRADFDSNDAYLKAYQAAYRRLAHIKKHGIPPEEVVKPCPKCGTKMERADTGFLRCTPCVKARQERHEKWAEMMRTKEHRKAEKEAAKQERKAATKAIRDARMLAKKLAREERNKQRQASKAALTQRPVSLEQPGFFLTPSEINRLNSKLFSRGDCIVCRQREQTINGHDYPVSRLLWYLNHGPIPIDHNVVRTCSTNHCVKHASVIPRKPFREKVVHIPSFKEIQQLTEAQIHSFNSRINKDGDCWVWTGDSQEDGYGRFYCPPKVYAAHRIAYALHYGSIPSDKAILHTCDSPYCVNPTHMTLGSYKDNLNDSIAKGRFQNERFVDKTHIPTSEETTEIQRLLSLKVKPKSISTKFGVSLAIIESLRK